SFLSTRPPPPSTLFPYTTLFRSSRINHTRLRCGRWTRDTSSIVPRPSRHSRARKTAPPYPAANVPKGPDGKPNLAAPPPRTAERSEEHTSELQSHLNLVCRLLLE